MGIRARTAHRVRFSLSMGCERGPSMSARTRTRANVIVRPRPLEGAHWLCFHCRTTQTTQQEAHQHHTFSQKANLTLNCTFLDHETRPQDKTVITTMDRLKVPCGLPTLHTLQIPTFPCIQGQSPQHVHHLLHAWLHSRHAAAGPCLLLLFQTRSQPYLVSPCGAG